MMIFVIFTSGCEKDHIVEDGMKPVYYSYDDFSELRSGTPIPYGDLSKIVAAGNYVFINEVGKGIHVIDNTNPESPIKIYFWYILGNTEFTINNNVLYANNGKHLLTIDISDFGNISLIKVIKNQYEPEDLELYPENYTGYFECYDGSKGILLRWERSLIVNPYCETN
jgi:hypothetical protein